ncbi:hypothetical protein [Nocardia araoensis]|uniref:hypothetical protein n=1 Tax=Nocardia araoensis TaxID=228600 RepID=UPI0002E80756|nr:hypothetical protein [Nocardia araoensis]
MTSPNVVGGIESARRRRADWNDGGQCGDVVDIPSPLGEDADAQFWLAGDEAFMPAVRIGLLGQRGDESDHQYTSRPVAPLLQALRHR